MAAGFLAYAGARLRAAHRPEPPLPPESETEPTVRRRPPGDEAPAQLSFDEAETQRLRE